MCRPARYYRRHRRIPILTGYETDKAGASHAILTEDVPALTTRWYYGVRRRKPHNVYVYGGIWYRHVNAPVEVDADGTRSGHVHALEPIADEWLFDRFAAQTAEQGRVPVVRLHVQAGRVVEALGADGYDMAGAQLLDGTETTDYVDELLDVA
jgi:hypothetical protein